MGLPAPHLKFLNFLYHPDYIFWLDVLYKEAILRGNEINKNLFEDDFRETLQQIESMRGVGDDNRFSISIYTPYSGGELYNRALQLGLKALRSLAGWSKFMTVPEDAFEKDVRRRWITRSQALRITMLTQ